MPPRRKPTDEERHAQSARRRAQRAAVALNDPERHAEIREDDALSQQNRRSQEDPAATSRRRAEDVIRHHASRAVETPLATNRRRAEDASRRYDSREMLSDLARLNIQEANAQRNVVYRQDMTPEDRIQSQDFNASQHRLHRAELSPEAHNEARTINTDQRREQRENMDQDELDDARVANTATRRSARTTAATAVSPFLNLAINCDVSTVETFDLGPMDVVCYYCSAKGYKSERKGTIARPHLGSLCCNAGKKVLPTFESPIDLRLRSLYTANDPKSKYFRKNARKFNSGMAMASMRGKDVSLGLNGVSAYKIQGQLTRFVGPLIPLPHMAPKFLQIYMYDPDDATDFRIANIRSPQRLAHRLFDAELFYECHEILLASRNAYINTFLSVKEQVDAMPDPPRNFFISMNADQRPQGEHSGRFNLPTTSEVSILMPTEVDGRSKREIVCCYRARVGCWNFTIMDDTHRSYDPMQYPLMFPDGRDGWNITMRDPLFNKKVTLNQYVSYHLMVRNSVPFSPIHHLNKLGQQWIVDQYCKMELGRMHYLKTHQKDLRADLYTGLADNLLAGDLEQTGRPIILPSSFTGGPRYMHQQYQDAMAITNAYGPPTFFITMTADTHWPEVLRELKPGQIPQDRPDILCRVFQAKKKQLLLEIDEGLFGPTKARVHSIEFQKRGSPHMHLLVWLLDFEPTPAKIDSMISAEIPAADSPLREIICKSYIHGPCGTINPNCSCMRQKQCTKRFPKEFRDHTDLGDDAYANYRRRSVASGGHTCDKWHRGTRVVMNNSSVVPYSPYLTMRFKCHLNVELCASVLCIKYVVKYQHKGNDMATVSIEDDENRNEIESFMHKRYVSSCEACWRVFGYEICGRIPAIRRLPIHLPGAQNVVYDPNNALLALENAETTLLTAYFVANRDLPGAADYLYKEFPIHFVWLQAKKKWKMRTRVNIDKPKTIGRIITIHPAQIEAFCVRTLLLHVKGATSFDHLKTVDGVVMETFKAACIALNLIETDILWIDCMREAILDQTARMCRQLFVYLLLYCNLSEPLFLYDMFLRELKDDHLHTRLTIEGRNAALAEEYSINDLLCDIQIGLRVDGKTCEHFGLAIPDMDLRDALDAERNQQGHNKAQAFFDVNHPLLNVDQLALFDAVTALIANGQGGLIFGVAPAGTGKTFTVNVLLASQRKNGCVAYGTAACGIAACLLHEGTTSHFRFKFPIPINAESICTINFQSDIALGLRDATLLVIDEGPMLHKHNFEALDRYLKRLMGSTLPFGGKVVLITGDFRQILPIVPRGSRASIVNASIKRSDLWEDVTVLNLSINMRVQAMIDVNPTVENIAKLSDFSSLLLDVGTGNVPTVTVGQPPHFEDNVIEIPGYMWRDSPMDVIDSIYDDFELSIGQASYLKKRAMLSTTNSIVNSINDDMINRIPNEGEHRLVSIDTVSGDDSSTLYPEEILNKVESSGIPQHVIRLKKNAVVILLRNLDNNAGHCNGTRYIVLKIHSHMIEARRLDADENEDNILIPRIPMCTKTGDFPFTMRRLQFPIKVAFVMTFNRSQGQSLMHTGIILPSSVWTHGQLYVGLSRCGNPDNIAIWANQEEFVLEGYPSDNKYTRNVVYTEIFRDN